MHRPSTSRQAALRGLGRGVKLSAGMVLSGAAMIGGFWLIENTTPILAVGALSAGFYLLMILVADDLVPGASRAVTGFMKLTTVMVFFGWMPLALWLMWAGKPL